MLNVNQITATLAKLPDQQLQQYAAMHKNDPYIVSLAVAESNRRKAMRDGAQVNQAPQPKVVDADIASMAQPEELPEDQGIARLPAGDMDFADGGIVAFAGGGTSYNDPGNAPWINALLNSGLTETEKARQKAIQDELDARLRAKNAGELEAVRTANMERVNSASTPLPNDYVRSDPRAAGMSLPSATAQLGLPENNTPSPIAAGAAQALAQGAGSGSASAYRRTGGGGGPVPDTLSLYNQISDLTSKQTYPELERGRRELASGLQGLAEEDLRLTRERDARFADALKPREERLAQREIALERDKEENKGLALLQTGMALMSTPGPVGQAFGKAALMGTDKYASGLDKLKAAQDRLDMAKDQLDDLKLNRAEMSAKEIQDKQLGIKRAALEGNKLMLEGYEKTLGLNKQDAHTLLTAAASNANARIAANAQVDAAYIRYGNGGAGGDAKMAQIANKLMSDVRTAANKAFPYPSQAADREAYYKKQIADALQLSPALAQYVGAGNTAPAPAAGAAFKFNPATGQIEPLR